MLSFLFHVHVRQCISVKSRDLQRQHQPSWTDVPQNELRGAFDLFTTKILRMKPNVFFWVSNVGRPEIGCRTPKVSEPATEFGYVRLSGFKYQVAAMCNSPSCDWRSSEIFRNATKAHRAPFFRGSVISAALRVVATETLMVQNVSYSTLDHECTLRTSGPLLIYSLLANFSPSSGMVGMVMICKNARQVPRTPSQEARMCDVIARPTVAS